MATAQLSSIAPYGLIVLRSAEIGFHLSNAGADVSIWKDGHQYDQFLYTNAKDGISIGRDDEGAARSFCTPSLGQPNAVVPPSVSIILQSGSTSGEVPVSMNIDTQAAPAFSNDRCAVDFGDGSEIAASCNPGAHTYSSAGAFLLRLTYTDSCSTTVVRTLDIVATAKQNSSPTATQTGGGGGGGTAASSLVASSVPCTPHASADVRIRAFLPDPEGADDDAEWIELENSSGQSITLCGWSVDDEEGGSRPYALGTSSIPAGGTLRIGRADSGLALNNDGDTVRLIKPDGSIQAVTYAKAPSGATYVRGTEGAFSWSGGRSSATSSRSSSATSVQSGIVRQYDGAGELTVDGIGEGEISARLQDVLCPSETLFSSYQKIGKIEFDRFIGALIEGKKFDLQLYSKNAGKQQVRLLKNGEDIAQSLIKNGFCIADNNAPPEYFAAEAAAKKAKAGLWSMSAAARMVRLLRSTIDSQFSTATSVIISEIVPTGPAEWVELYNPSDETVQLHDWMVDDAADAGSKPHLLSSGAVIGARAYLVLTGKALSISLNDGGDSVRLLHPDGSSADDVAYPKLKKDYALARVGDAWCVSPSPTPGKANVCATEATFEPEVLGETIVLNKAVVVQALSRRRAGGVQPEGAVFHERHVRCLGQQPRAHRDRRRGPRI
jgi:endonuclease YncB( thermonuclease family)/phage baseplate assembly protein gpV